ncbi:hypothetical protein [Flaviflexus massiliensis]|uniref:hypothetical protein n=1 Tax=Flaviflexus massiliensis TaxID=1522309 RepID=UPI0006D54994|nr:hypothetical protein [Flaviflexus massiliensis]
MSHYIGAELVEIKHRPPRIVTIFSPNGPASQGPDYQVGLSLGEAEELVNAWWNPTGPRIFENFTLAKDDQEIHVYFPHVTLLLGLDRLDTIRLISDLEDILNAKQTA